MKQHSFPMLKETHQEEISVTNPSHELHRLEETNVHSLSESVLDDPNRRQMMGRNMNSVKEISTAFNGGKAQYGAMFDIRSLPNNEVRIDSLAFHTLDAVQRCNIQIFTKRGSHEFFEEESSAWKRIKSVTTECRGPGRKTVVSLSEGNKTNYDDMRINRSERRAFYIRSIETQIIYSVAEKQNTVYKEDDHVQIFTGVAVGQYFKDFWTPRMLNVAATYVIERIWNGQVGIGGLPTFGKPIGDDVCTSKLDVMTKDGVNKNYGIMFNIKSNSERDLTVYGLGFYVDTSSRIEYEIYTLGGGFEHGSATLSLWTKVASGQKKDASRGTMVMVSESDFAAVNIKSGETYGFYLTLHTENLQYHSTSVTLSSTYMQNKDLIVSVGAGVGGYPFDETDFLARRSLKGTILYGIDKECRPEVSVKFTFIVNFPKHMSTDEVYGEINTTVEKIINFFLRSDESLQHLKKSFDLQLSSVFSQHDPDPPAICTQFSDNTSCDTVVTEMIFDYQNEGMDEGHVSYKVLQHVNTVVNNLNSGALHVEYTGEETLVTSMVITLDGVPNKEMSNDEVGLFQGVTRGFLKQKEEGTVKVLSVQVQEQRLQNRRSLSESSGNFVIRAGQESGQIEIKTKVSGKHLPPSPGLNFDQLVEDSINAEDSTFRDELKKGSEEAGFEYFEEVRKVYAKPVPIFPTQAPLEYEPPKSNGISGPISIAIIVIAALLTFGLVFGAFVYRKRQQDKKRYRKSIFDDDEDDPLFFDVFDGKRPHNHTTIIPPFTRSKSSKRAPSVVTAETGALTENTSAMMSRAMSSFRGMSVQESGRFPVDRPPMRKENSRRSSRSFQMNAHGTYGGQQQRRHSLNSNKGNHGIQSEYNDRMYRSTPVIAQVLENDYDDRMQKFRNGPAGGFEQGNSGMMNRPNPRVMTIDPDYEDKILRKFQERRPSYPEANYTSRSPVDLYEERMRTSATNIQEQEMNRQYSRQSAHSSEHDERIRRKYQGYSDGDVMARTSDRDMDLNMERQRSRQSAYSGDHEERIRKKFQGLQEEKDRMRREDEVEMERQRSRQSAYSGDHEERIRKKFQGMNDDEDMMRQSNNVSGMERQRSKQSAYSSEKERSRQSAHSSEKQRSRQSAISNEHEERIRLKQQGFNDLNRTSEQQLTGNDFEGNREWDTRKKHEEPQEPQPRAEPRIDLPAHMRFERRPSEDGLGVDVMSESTTSTLSSHFTKIKNQEGADRK